MKRITIAILCLGIAAVGCSAQSPNNGQAGNIKIVTALHPEGVQKAPLALDGHYHPDAMGATPDFRRARPAAGTTIQTLSHPADEKAAQREVSAPVQDAGVLVTCLQHPAGEMHAGSNAVLRASGPNQ